MQVRDDDSHQPNRSRILTFTVSVEAPYCWKADEYRGRIAQILREKLGVECLLNVAHVPASTVVEPTPGVVKRQKAEARRAAKLPRHREHPPVTADERARRPGPPAPLRDFGNPALIRPKRTPEEKRRQYAEMYGMQFTGGEIDLPGGGLSILGFDAAKPGGDDSAVVAITARHDGTYQVCAVDGGAQSLGEIAARLVAEVEAKRAARTGKRQFCCHKTVLKGGQCEDCPYVD